jgi:hypothetical protein
MVQSQWTSYLNIIFCALLMKIQHEVETELLSTCLHWFFYFLFLGAFKKLQRVTVSFAMSICLSVHPHGTTWLPLDGFSWNLIFEYWLKMCWENSSFVRIRQVHITDSLHEHLWIFIIYRWILKMRSVRDKNRDKIKTRILLSITLFQKIVSFMK